MKSWKTELKKLWETWNVFLEKKSRKVEKGKDHEWNNPTNNRSLAHNPLRHEYKIVNLDSTYPWWNQLEEENAENQEEKELKKLKEAWKKAVKKQKMLEIVPKITIFSNRIASLEMFAMK